MRALSLEGLWAVHMEEPAVHLIVWPTFPALYQAASGPLTSPARTAQLDERHSQWELRIGLSSQTGTEKHRVD